MHDVLMGCDGQGALARELVWAKRLSKMTVRPTRNGGHFATTPLYFIILILVVLVHILTNIAIYNISLKLDIHTIAFINSIVYSLRSYKEY